MANTANPRGFSPANPILRMHYHKKTTSQIMYPGDAVSLAADGKVYLRSTGNTTLAGVVAGYAAAATTDVLLFDDPDQQYYIQDDGVSGTLSQASVGNGFNIVMTAGTATWNKSKQALDTDTGSATTSATLQLRLLGFHPSDEVGKYVRCRVKFNDLALFQKRATYV